MSRALDDRTIANLLEIGGLDGYSEEEVARIADGSANAISAVAASIDFPIFDGNPRLFYAVLESLGDEYT